MAPALVHHTAIKARCQRWPWKFQREIAKVIIRSTIVFILPALVLGCPKDSSGARQVQHLSLRETQRVGSVDGEDGLSRILGFALGPRRDIYVTQWQVPSVTVFGPQGDVIRRIGRQGSGPGEFRGVGAVGFVGNRLWVQTNDRVVAFDTLGRFVEEAGFRRGLPDARLWYAPVRYAASGDVIAEGTGRTSILAGHDSLWIPLLITASSGEILDTVAVVPAPREWVSLSFDDEVTYTRLPGLFPPRYLYAPNGRTVVLLAIADSEADSTTLHAYWVNTHGDTLAHHSRRFPSAPFPREMREATLEILTNRLAGNLGMKPARLRAVADGQIPWPQERPIFTAAVVGQDDHLWLKMPGEEGVGLSRWEVWTPYEGLVADAQIPSDATVLYADAECVWVELKDTLDVPFLVRYALDPDR